MQNVNYHEPHQNVFYITKYNICYGCFKRKNHHAKNPPQIVTPVLHDTWISFQSAFHIFHGMQESINDSHSFFVHNN